MPDLNDVVRHVILRIIVDQAGLAEELAAARAKLKALKDTERDINKERAKQFEGVTKAIEQQSTALAQNARAHEAAQRAASGQNREALSGIRERTAGIEGETQALKGQILEEAKADAIRSKARQDELRAQQERAAARRRDATEEQRLLEKNDALKQSLSNKELDRAKRERDARANANRVNRAQVQNIQARTTTEAARTATETARTGTEAERTNTQVARTEAVQAGTARADANAIANRARADADSLANNIRKDATSSANTARADATAASNTARSDATAAANTARADATAASNTARADANAVAENIRRDALNAAKVAGTQQKTADSAAESAAKRGTSDARTAEVQARSQPLVDTVVERTEAERAKAQSTTERAVFQSQTEESRAAKAAREAETAAAKALNEQDRTNVEVGNRRRVLATALARTRADIVKVAAQANLLEAKAAETAQKALAIEERRARIAEANARRKQTVGGMAGAVLGDVATLVGRVAATPSPRSAIRRGIAEAETPDIRSQEEAWRRMTTTVGRAETAVSQFFRRFTRDGESSLRFMSSFQAKLRNVVDELNKPRRGGGGNLFGDIFKNFINLGDKIGSAFSGAGRHLFSFQSLIIAVIAALGPLAAVLGAVGAAALALASDLGALVGVVGALPGILGAAVAGFGALAMVMKPITSVFSAYTAAQKDATNAATKETRATNALADARVAAKRKLEDYQTSLRRLKLDEEGAALGVEAAKQAYMQALVDPTSSALDVAQAKHSYEQALADQQDQKTNARRTREDAATAQQRGIEGSTEVQSAKQSAAATAQQQFQNQLDKLPPKTRTVVKAILDLGDAYKKMRDRFSENIFGPISTETGKFAKVLKSLEDFMTPATEAIGQFAKEALDLFTNPEWEKFFKEQGVESGYIIRQLGTALLNTADAFRGITEAARPFTRFIVDGILGMSAAFKSFADSDDGRAKIASFLELTEKRMRELWPIIKNLASGIVGFFAALNLGWREGKDFTTWFNNGLLKASETFADLGKKAQDPQGGFQKWLKDVKPLLHDIVEFLKSAATFFGDLFSDQDNINEARSTLQQIAQRWLPALADIFDKMSQSGMISKLATALSGAFDALNSFFDHGGLSTLTAFADAVKATGSVLNGLASAVSWLSENVPFLGDAFKAVGTVIGLFFGAALLARLSGLTKMFSLLLSTAKGAGNVIGSIIDREPGEKSRVKGAVQGGIDRAKDTILGRNRGESAARRQAREQARQDKKDQKPGSTRPGSTRPGSTRPSTTTRPTTPTIDRTGTGGVIPHLSRIERLLQQIVINTRGGGTGRSGIDVDPNGPDDDGKGGKGGKGGRRTRTTTRTKPSFGPESIDDAIDPNSPEGIRQRKEAVQKARTERLQRGSTALGRTEAAIRDELTPARPSRFSGIKSVLSKGGRGLGKVLGSVAGLSGVVEPKILDPIVDRPTPPVSKPSVNVKSTTFDPYNAAELDTYEPPTRTPSGKLKPGTQIPGLNEPRPVTVAQAPQPRDARGRIQARPAPTQYDYTPLSDSDLKYTAPRVQPSGKVIKGTPVPGLNEPYTVQRPPQPRDPSGRVLPRPAPQSHAFDPYTFPPELRTTGLPEGPAMPPRLDSTAQHQFDPLDIDSIPAEKRTLRSRLTGAVRRATAPVRRVAGAVKSAARTAGRGLSAAGRAIARPYLTGDDTGSIQLRDRPVDVDVDEDETTRRSTSADVEDSPRRRASLDVDVDEDKAVSRGTGRAARRGLSAVEDVEETVAKRGGRLGRAARALGAVTKVGGKAGGKVLGTVAKGGGKLLGRAAGGLAKAGGGLLRGAAGGIGGLVAGAALQLGGQAAIDHFVKDDEDAASLSRGLGAVSTGAGIGSMVGSVIPGVGTVIGGAVGGAIGGAYSLVKDKNLRNFVGGKIAGGAKAVGGAIKGAAGAVGGFVGDLFGGGDKDGGVGEKVGKFLPLLLGPIGLAFTGAGKSVGKWFDQHVIKPVVGFFTGIGRFFADVGKSVGKWINTYIIKPIVGVLSVIGGLGLILLQAIYKYILTPLGHMFASLGKKIAGLVGQVTGWINDHVVKPILGFFTALGKAAWALIDKVSDWVYKHVQKPILDFFIKIAKGAWALIVKVSTWLYDHVQKPIVDFFIKIAKGAWALIVKVSTWIYDHIQKPVLDFFAKIKSGAVAVAGKVAGWVEDHITKPIGDFFASIKKGAEDVAKKVSGWIEDHITKPVGDFFSSIGNFVSGIPKALRAWAEKQGLGGELVIKGLDLLGLKKGGFVPGTFTGQEDTVLARLTPDEFVLRRERMKTPEARRFATDWNEGRLDITKMYSGLAAATAPQVMSMVPPETRVLTGAVPAVVNNTVNHAPLMGDVTINNPIREKAEWSLRRRVELANIRHRR